MVIVTMRNLALLSVPVPASLKAVSHPRESSENKIAQARATSSVISTSISTTTVSAGGGGGAPATVTQTVTAPSTSSGVDPTLLYGVAAVAVIFIVATGFFATRSRRKPAP